MAVVARGNIGHFRNGHLVASPATAAAARDAPRVGPSAVKDLVAGRDLVILSLPNCVQCDKLKEEAQAAGSTRVAECYVKWDKASEDYAELRRQLVEITGQDKFTYPQAFVGGQHLGGFAEATAALRAATPFRAALGLSAPVSPTAVRELVASRPVVALSLPNCVQCEQLRGLLGAEGVADAAGVFTKWDKASGDYAELRRQLVEITGQDKFTYPQVFVSGAYVGGFTEAKRDLEAGLHREALGLPPKAAPALAFDDEDF